MPRKASNPASADAPSGQSSGRRLDSWKAIAAYFGRDTRTVQRWERTESLPVHRHTHEKGGTVYAFEAELDRWWQERAGRIEPVAAPMRKLPGKGLWLLAGALSLAVAATWLTATNRVPRQSVGRPIRGRLLANATSEGHTFRWIAVGRHPVAAIASPDGPEVYISNRHSGTISVIDTLRGRVAREIQVGGQPSAMAISADAGVLYAANGGGYISEIRLGRNPVVRSIPTGAPVSDLALTADGRHLYVAAGFAGLLEISAADRTVRQVSNAVAPMFLAAPPDSSRIYINYQAGGPGGKPGHDSIDALDVATGRVTGAVSGPPNVGGPIVASPDGGQVWANGENACWSPAYDRIGCPITPGSVVNVIRPSDNRMIRTLGFPAFYDTISFFSDGSRAVMSGDGGIRVVDTVRLATVESVELKGAGKIAFASDGKRAYCPIADRDAVAVLNLEAGACLAPPAGLVAWWPGDGGREDIRRINAASEDGEGAYAPGLVGQAFRLRESARALELQPPSWGATRDEMTLGAWVKFLPSETGARETALFDFSGPADSDGKGWRVVLESASGPRLRICGVRDRRQVGCGGFGMPSTVPPPAGAWTHLAVERTADRVVLSVNGVSAAEVRADGLPAADNVGLRVGPISTLVDEVQWFNRALGEGELKSIVKAGSAGLCYGPAVESR